MIATFLSTLMTKLAVLLAFAVINASTIPAFASECASAKEIDACRPRWATGTPRLAERLFTPKKSTPDGSRSFGRQAAASPPPCLAFTRTIVD